MNRVLREIAGYLLGFLIFIILLPCLMWWVGGKSFEASEWLWVTGGLLMAVGLTLSIWSIVHMRRAGKGNPFDAYGHEVAPRTQQLLIDGPYGFSRNPMLLGVFIYLGGIAALLHTWQAAAVWAGFVGIMLSQVRSEEKRLLKDFGNDYLDYRSRVHWLLGNRSRGLSFAIVALIYLSSIGVGVLTYRWMGKMNANGVLCLLGADVVATVYVWLFGLIYKNVSIYDPYWSVAPPVLLTTWLFIKGFNTPYLMLLVAVWLWGIRLTANWAYTFKGIYAEDWRYTRYRNNCHPFIFHIINFFGLNMMPTLLVFFNMLPALLLPEQHQQANILSWAALAVCLGAVAIELTADIQRHRFVRQHPNHNEILQDGLWKHGRHPNYFGEISMWWGVWLMYVSVNGFACRPWLIAAPIAMTALFLFISIPMMEKRQLENKPGYAAYRQRTRTLI